MIRVLVNSEARRETAERENERTIEDDVFGLLMVVELLVVKNDDLADVEHFTRERTADDRVLTVFDVHRVDAELVGRPPRRPPCRHVAHHVTRHRPSRRS